MKSGKRTEILLALILLVLLAHLLVPLFRTGEAAAISEETSTPAVAATETERPALEKAAIRIEDGLREIARSNKQIALAIAQHAQSNERIASSLDKVAVEIGSKQSVP